MKATVIGLVCVWLMCGMAAAWIEESRKPIGVKAVAGGPFSLQTALANS